MRRVRTGGGTDRGDIVIGWLVRLVVVLAVVGVLVFDGLSLLVGHLAVADSAAAAAREAGREIAAGATPQAAYLSAVEEVVADGAYDEVPAGSFVVDRTGAVTLTVVRDTPTLVLHHVPRSESWLTVRSTATWSGTS
ncbi:hypothetical protein [Aquipuribacter sp. SD81]|uniref:hypothetical protein n=1 Tax=Aquipuribacter sp. SD81 TaxID=3127703 RepID=UPI0030194809